MIKTLSIQNLEAKAANIYEAIIVLSKRARQVNSDQKQMRVAERDYEEEFSGYGEEDLEPEYDPDYEDLPKPTVIALGEFIDGKIGHKYPEKEPTGEAPEADSDSK